MRLVELIQGEDGRLDEQAALSIIGYLTLCGLEGYAVVVLRQAFDPQNFGIALGALAAATLGGMGFRASRGSRNAAVSDQPVG